MKAILEFNLNDHDEQQAHLRAVKSTHLTCALWDIQGELRKRRNQLESLDLPEEEFNSRYDEVEKMIQEIGGILESWDINLDVIMS